jgi:glutathione synthase/RimK-type ligase-like ATP-grasp enzyme
MPRHVVVVEREGDLDAPDSSCSLVSARDFIRRPPEGAARDLRVINLCHDYRYLGLGYYCSLLAEARGLKVMPSAEVMLELNWKRLYRTFLAELNEQLAKDVARTRPDPQEVTLRVYFGVGTDPRFEELARRTFDSFRCPILEVEIQAVPVWTIRTIRPASVRGMNSEQRRIFAGALERYTRSKWLPRRAPAPPRYSLAVLYDPKEEFPPSDPRALKRIESAGESLGIDVELITRHDLGRLSEFDALFIRETTNLDHHTYRFAKKAVAEGMPVIDDPVSILRCSNKVFLAEMFRLAGVPTPHTLILDRSRLHEAPEQLGFPMVVKIPDGSFSRGVFKIENGEELERVARRIFEESDIILAQEFIFTEFDWRIGVLNHRPLFACQYRMSRNHWQILKHEEDGRVLEGHHQALPVAEVPRIVLEAALAATRGIGDGLYGVDIKQTPQGVFVMEVNDNPNIYSGLEDEVTRGELYRTLLLEFVRRLEARANSQPAPKEARVAQRAV